MQTQPRETICPIFDGSLVVCGSSDHHLCLGRRQGNARERKRRAASNLVKDKPVTACPTASCRSDLDVKSLGERAYRTSSSEESAAANSELWQD